MKSRIFEQMHIFLFERRQKRTKKSKLAGAKINWTSPNMVKITFSPL